MRKQIFGTFAVLSLLLAFTIVSAQAQSRNSVTAHIPFAFQIGDKTLPAGDYSVKRLSQNALVVESADGAESVIAQAPRSVQSNANAKPGAEKLVFRQYGEQYFLAQVWMIKGGAGRELNMTGAERKAASELKIAQHGAKPQSIEVAAR
ncbi:MAG: hypothetical protein QOF02_3213 [Blastocatellia bacterium]|nr:hypothetical protein [Blastocatellia bacterium]